MRVADSNDFAPQSGADGAARRPYLSESCKYFVELPGALVQIPSRLNPNSSGL